MRGRSRFKVSRYRRERLVALERKVEFLEGERARLERLLALALRAATGGTTVDPLAFLTVLCELSGDDPVRAAFLDDRKESLA